MSEERAEWTRHLTILYGSQTGTAEDLAERLSRGAKNRHFRVKIESMDDYAISELINEKLIVFVCSTTGQGEEPDNMKMFWRFLLRRNLPTNSLQNLQSCVIGLGDSSYQKFNFVAKKLHKRLIQLGSEPIMPLVLGDDQHEYGPDGVINPWIYNFWTKIMDMYPLPNGLNVIGDDALPSSKFRVEFLKDRDVKKDNWNFVNGDIPEKKESLVTLISNDRITSPEHFQDVRLVRFNIQDSGITYDPGHVAVIEPRNLKKNVEDFLKLLNVKPEQRFLLHQNDSDISLPQKLVQPCSVQECVESYWDISSVPRRSFFELFWHFSRSELEKEKLHEFCEAQGQEELYSYCNRPRRTILEVMQDFPHTTPHVPFEYLFDLIPPIKPRFFSIASSPLAHTGEINLLVAVVKYKTKLYSPREGLCSNWLASLKPGNNVVVSLTTKKGSISLPPMHKPIIMIGPGTGCAPFRGFIHERCFQNIGQNYLFFGCRNEKGDFYFEKEWISFIEKNMLQLFTAFSRDQEEKIYVHHKMLENKELIWDLINNLDAWIYVAGNAKQMPQDVHNALLAIIREGGSLDRKEAENYLKTLERNNRLQCEVWS